jgi:hypothetical protein
MVFYTGHIDVKSDIFTAVIMRSTTFWYVISCNLVKFYRHFTEFAALFTACLLGFLYDPVRKRSTSLNVYQSTRRHTGKKGKHLLVTIREGQYGCETSRLTHLLENWLTDGGKVVSLTRLPPFAPRMIPGTHFC